MTVDCILPCYREDDGSVARTVLACLEQDYPVRRIYLVDDGSPVPLKLAEGVACDERVVLLRREQNGGISRARNFAAGCSDADAYLFLNCDNLLDRQWLTRCVGHLRTSSHIGAVTGRLRVARPEDLLSQWRMRFIENKQQLREEPGEISYATGHAVLISREAFERVGGYDPDFHRTHEDWDICRRMRQKGYVTYYDPSVAILSAQKDTVSLLASCAIRHSGWSLDPRLTEDAVLRPMNRPRALWDASRGFLMRVGRNVAKMRFRFVMVDWQVFVRSITMIWGCGTGTRN